MPLLTLPFPEIDPVAVQIGPLAIRWYALAYIAALLLGWRYCTRLAHRTSAGPSAVQIDDLLVWVTLGVILGGRIGYVLFYQPGYYLSHPTSILMVWHGGMSFHGGLLGVAAAAGAFALKRRVDPLRVADLLAAAAPIGLLLGRLANFVNGELYGRVAFDLPWAMRFPAGGPLPRHPSQLYEAGLEGIVLFVLLYALVRGGALHRPGVVTGAFLAGYGAARIVAELFREPDPFLGYLPFGATMGQALSIPMVLVGAALIWRARRRVAAI